MNVAQVRHLHAVEPVTEDLVRDFAEYLARRRMSPKTILLRTGWIRRYERWLTETGRPSLLQAMFADAEDYVFSRSSWSPATSATLVSSLRVFYRWANQRGLSTTSAAELAPVRDTGRHGRTVSDDVVRSAVSRANVTDLAMLLLGAECGLRVAEICNVRLEDRDGEWLNVIGKGRRHRRVWMSPRLRATLDTIVTTRSTYGGWYFPGKNRTGPIAPSTAWRHVRRLAGVNTHALRHRAATAVYKASGHDLRLTQDFLGHSSPMTTAIYVHVDEDDLKRAGEFAALYQSE